jgi:hypothetical protein
MVEYLKADHPALSLRSGTFILCMNIKVGYSAVSHLADNNRTNGRTGILAFRSGTTIPR